MDNVSKLVNFLSGGSAARALSGRLDPRALQVGRAGHSVTVQHSAAQPLASPSCRHAPMLWPWNWLLLLTGTGATAAFPATNAPVVSFRSMQELAPLLPGVATQVLPELSRRLAGRITARLIRELFV